MVVQPFAVLLGFGGVGGRSRAVVLIPEVYPKGEGHRGWRVLACKTGHSCRNKDRVDSRDSQEQGP